MTAMAEEAAEVDMIAADQAMVDMGVQVDMEAVTVDPEAAMEVCGLIIDLNFDYWYTVKRFSTASQNKYL